MVNGRLSLRSLHESWSDSYKLHFEHTTQVSCLSLMKFGDEMVDGLMK